MCLSTLCSVKAIPLLTVVSTKGDKVGTRVHDILCTVHKVQYMYNINNA